MTLITERLADMSHELPIVDRTITAPILKETRSSYGNPFWAHRKLQDGTLEKVLAHRHLGKGTVVYVEPGQ